MPARVTIKNPQGLTDVLERLKGIASESVLREAIVSSLDPLIDEVKRRVPVGKIRYERSGTAHEPGFLRDHIIAFHNDERSVGGLRQFYGITWSKEAFYGNIIENGSSKYSATPFLRPAYDAKRRQVVKAIDQFIKAKAKELANGNG